ncbi:hypothetical protein Godav_003303 [Gossypium davidsonii]|uniref:Uncharacterized protein n=1 Tax=Gossypium davidsonii TaxID=34287 RepID=A0A7J8TAI4_GOSDV|nr:hypothetical protein [Gossypium davidsonii]
MTNGLVLSLLVVSLLAMVAAVGRDDRVVTALCKAKDKILDIAHEANKLKQATSGTVHKSEREVVQKGQDVKERVKESIDKANEAATTTEDTTKTMGDDIVTNTSKQVENVQEKAMEESVQATNKVKTSANKFLDGLKYMTSMEALNTVMGIANLLGLAKTYGMSV